MKPRVISLWTLVVWFGFLLMLMATNGESLAAPAADSGDKKIDPKLGPLTITVFEFIDPTLPGKVGNTQAHAKWSSKTRLPTWWTAWR